ncbi:SDR family oxidoreductase [Litoreibacter roseus]|uniref:Short chain dehydrogenase n=1 Tax=Litoreibacter roseus TaxID=2601869 RepID=A0A6N6JFS6_9RHOB|nr:SDR family oxidoreductase [Litoreibacter roseus]GFE64817.1 short chain dehydrogenase [Litoreibacter roseus]
MSVARKAGLVTGAGGRLGRAMAVELAEMGFDVAIHYASSDKGALETARLVEAVGRKAAVLKADLLDADQTDGLVERAKSELGQLTVLINNASIFEHDTIETATRDSWARHIGSNLHAPFVLTQAFAAQAPATARDAEGEQSASACVINMVDQRVRKLTPEFMTYTIAKMGLWAFTQTAAQALAPAIRVNGIGPGPTLQGGRQSAEHFQEQREATILGRGSTPKGIVRAMRYLIETDEVTGQLLCVDGGQHLGWQTPDVLGVE